ncbi:transposase [Porifericola rhodea]|uniref:REP-associated tyrosine transposase n=1 Tax=Porifericola rhodea TaxID=930972 RepID=UPI0026652999|nr:transposase [Porifericola rhodea]WKN32910.1 transposase [Porifericola rhodea]
MPSRYIISDHQALYFVTFTTVEWIDALPRLAYKNVVVESLRYCTQEKGLIICAYVVMSNHIHLIISAQEGFNLSDILRDLKKFTSKRLIEAIIQNPQESRNRWMLWIFRSAGQRNSNNKYYQFWQQDNHPVELSNNQMMDQRLDYIHQNTVAAGLVYEVNIMSIVVLLIMQAVKDY